MAEQPPKVDQSPPLVDLRHYLERLIQYEHDMTEARFTAVSEAVNKAERSMTIRLESMNEFRKQLENQESRYVPKAQFDGNIETINSRLERLERAENIMTGKTAMLWMIIVFALGALGLIVKYIGD